MRRNRKNLDEDGQVAPEASTDAEDVISKSQRKRDMTALQEVGEQLAALSTDALKKFDLPEDLVRAIVEAKKIQKSKFGAQKRQMQYIGRLMRDVDAGPIIARLQDMKAPGRQANALHHLAERWRERLLADSTALAAFVREFPGTDGDAMARNLAAARDEQAKGKPPKHFRLLYQTIHRRLQDGT